MKPKTVVIGVFLVLLGLLREPSLDSEGSPSLELGAFWVSKSEVQARSTREYGLGTIGFAPLDTEVFEYEYR